MAQVLPMIRPASPLAPQCDLPALDVCLPDILKGFAGAQTKAEMRRLFKVLTNALYVLNALHSDEWEAILTTIEPQRIARQP